MTPPRSLSATRLLPAHWPKTLPGFAGLAFLAGMVGCGLPASDPGSEMLALLSGKGGAGFSDRLTALESLIRREIPNLEPNSGLADSVFRLRLRLKACRSTGPTTSQSFRAVDSLLDGIRLVEPTDPDSAFRLSLPGEGLRLGATTRLGRGLLLIALLEEQASARVALSQPTGFAIAVKDAAGNFRDALPAAAQPAAPDAGPPLAEISGRSGPYFPPETLLALLADAFATQLIAAGRPAAAEGVCRAVLAALPGYPPALRNLSVTLAAQGRSEEAARVLANAENGGGPQAVPLPVPD